ncbi:alpha/beta hydrolase [Flavobacteriaceae bacterium]|nr:alpha/beta hydrolase [Flavobacteriaceae bacterium]
MVNITKYHDFNKITKPTKLVVILHGYGANGKNLISLGQEFFKILPNAYFVAPNAPQDHEGGAYDGFQWFSLMGNISEIAPEIIKANVILNNFIKQKLEKFSLGLKDLILVGFSQGAMMSIYNALVCEEEVGAVIAFSGRLISPAYLNQAIKSKPKICLIHGEDDNVVSFENLSIAYDGLKDVGVKVEKHAISDLDHQIDVRGVYIANNFLKNL